MDLSGNKFGTAGADALAPELGKLTSLSDLGLSDCKFKFADSEALVAALVQLKRLTSYRHSGNIIAVVSHPGYLP